MIDQLIKNIKANRCILFLGPQMATFRERNNSWISHTKMYCSDLKNELQLSNVAFDINACNNPYYLATKYLDGTIEKINKEAQIFNKIYINKESEIYEDLAIIPFNTIVNFGFDNFMPKALRKAGYQFEYDFYNYKGIESLNLNVDNDMPLVYNIFGSINVTESRIHNERQELQFLRTINSSPKIPTDLLSRIKEDTKGSKSYIFLGFNFNEWPFRFLLDTLEIPKANLSVTSVIEDINIAIMTHDFYFDRFGINFLDKSPKEFVTELIKEYKKNSNIHTKGYISYHKNDEDIKDEFKAHLRTHSLTKRRNVTFFDRDMLTAADIISETVAKKLDEATIYIPFLSVKSINDIQFEEELNKMISRPEVLIFPIIVKNCLWRDVFPSLEERAAIVLPTKDSVLVSSTKNPSDDDYIKMLTIINTKIR